MTISQRIFTLLKEKKLIQKELALRTGISESAISDWKKKGTNPAADKISAIADFLGVSVDYLLTGQEKGQSFKLSNNEVDCLSAFNQLTYEDQMKFIGRMEATAEAYAPETKDSVSNANAS